MSWLKRMLGGGETKAPAPASPAFEPLNEIERLLMDAAVRPDAQPVFERALLDAQLFAVTPQAPATHRERILGEGESLQLYHVESPQGTAVAAIFTAKERIGAFFQRETGYVAMRGEDLLGLVSTTGAWLNPGASYGVCWSAQDLAAILGKPVSRTIEKDTQVLLGSPADPPVALIDALTAVLGHDARIAGAWLALAHWPDGTSAWHLDIRTDLPVEAVQALLADTFKTADYAGRPLDMVVNAPDGSDGTGIRIAPA